MNAGSIFHYWNISGIKNTEGKPIKIMQSDFCSTRRRWILTYRATPGEEMSFLGRLELFSLFFVTW
jgi:hypothetical protein